MSQVISPFCIEEKLFHLKDLLKTNLFYKFLITENVFKIKVMKISYRIAMISRVIPKMSLYKDFVIKSIIHGDGLGCYLCFRHIV